MLQDSFQLSEFRKLAAWADFADPITGCHVKTIVQFEDVYFSEPTSSQCQDAANRRKIDEENMICATKVFNRHTNSLVSSIFMNFLTMKISQYRFKTQKTEKYINIHLLNKFKISFKNNMIL